MTSVERASAAVQQCLAEGDGSPLGQVELTAALQREVERHQRAAVLAAQDRHSWAEIGAALGISKQAAHRKFVTALADDLKAKHQEMKHARRAGLAEDAAAALQDVVATADTLRKVRRVR